MFGRVWVEKVFRGKSYGEYELSKTAYKNDFKLVPKDEEEAYIKRTLSAEEIENLKKPIPEFLEFPPLLKVSFDILLIHSACLHLCCYNCNIVHV